MAEFKDMTVHALRELARKAIGRGHSKLKTKAELIEALQAAEKKVADAAEKAAEKVKDATRAVARATEKVVGAARARGRAGAAGAKQGEPGAQSEKPAREGKERKAAPGRSRAAQAAREAVGAVREVAAAAKAEARRIREARGEPEPDPEGYMVARVAGEDAVRGAPHPMTESAMEAQRRPPPVRDLPAEQQTWPNDYDEQLGELPWSYADDVLVVLPRDPRTLFLYWDHGEETVREAFRDLDGGRAQLWIFARASGGGWTRVRAVDFALESRSYYVHDLDPSGLYRAEIHVVDRRGADRLLGSPSNETALPQVGPSPIVDDLFLRILWGEPLDRRLRAPHAGAPFPDDARAQLARLSDWSRFAGRFWGGSAGGMGGRPFSPMSSPSAPGSPSSPWGRTNGEGP